MTVLTFYYEPFGNYFSSDEVEFVYDIFKYISPNKLLLIKSRPGIYYFYPKDCDIVYEFNIPYEGEDGYEYW